MSISSTGLSHHELHGDPIAVTFKVASKLTGLGQTSLWKLSEAGGPLKRVHVPGIRRTMLDFSSLRRLLTPPQSQKRKRGRPRKSPPIEATT
jgi:hypothetical protein